MPKLARFRLVSIGHPNARMQDLMLNFCDQEGEASDSTLWLRNGGGKSSILNLFFAMLRTGRREFLGGRADSKQRRLEDYVLSNDRSVVAAEWILDLPPAELDLDQAHPRFITGVFYERIPGREGLRRLFFCTRIANDVPETTLQGIPILSENVEGLKVRRTLASFRQRWHELRDQYPSLQGFCTEIQSDWRDRLQSAGLDPGLFSYQLRMNLREGGADELFRFNSPDDFIDFLLELTLDPTKSDNLTENLATFQKQLQQRKHELIPDLDLSTGLIERLSPLVELHNRRQQSLTQSQRLLELFQQIKHSIRQNMSQIERKSDEQDARIQQFRELYTQKESEAYTARGIAAAIQWELAKKELALHEKQLVEIKEDLEEARRQNILWRAAIPLRNAQLSQADADSYRSQFSGQSEQRAPLIDKLQDSARKYVAALRHQAQVLRKRQSEGKDAYSKNEAESRNLESQASKLEAAATALGAEIKSLELNLKKRDDQRRRLINLGILRDEENAAQAAERIAGQCKQLQSQIDRIVSNREVLDAQEDELGRQIQELQRTLSDKKASHAQLRSSLDKALAERGKLENDPNLLRALELEQVDLDSVPDDVAATMNRRAAEQLERAARLRAEKSVLERARLSLQDHGLMPPSMEVEAILEFLGAKSAAKSGWAYICENYADDVNERLRIVRLAPELANGIVVPAKDLERIKGLIEAHPNALPDIPITLASPEAFYASELQDLKHRVVLGPKTNAWFDKAAAQQSLLSLEDKMDALDEQLAAAQKLQADFSDVALKFRHFRNRYGRGYFSEQQSNMVQLAVACEDAQARLEMTSDERRRVISKRKDDEAKIQSLREDLSNQRAVLERLQDFGDELEDNQALWSEEITLKSMKREEHLKAATELRQKAKLSRENAAHQLKLIEPFAEEARLLESQISQIRYVQELPEPEQGSIDELKKSYDRLIEQVERELGSDELLRSAELHESHAQRYRAEAQRIIKGIMQMQELEDALKLLENPNDVELNAQNAEERYNLVQNRERDATEVLYQARSSCKQLEKAWIGLGKPTLPAKIADAPTLELAHKHDEMAKSAFKELDSIQHSIREQERAKDERKHQYDSLQKDLERLGSVQRNHSQTLEVEQQQLEFSESIAPNDIAYSINDLETKLDERKKDSEALDEERRSAVLSLKKWIDESRFSQLQNKIIPQFRTMQDEDLESSALSYRESLAVRIREISHTLSDIDKHRNLLSKLLLNAAEEGLRLLKLADRASAVPLNVPEIGGSQFLRISSKEPSSPNDRLELIQDLVDKLIDEDVLPTGVVLVQRAVRQLARPFRVRVLNPDPGSPQRFIEITETARFSGGEQLTCAILLYCTLANVRARTRGLNRQPTGVLVLDNPIGRASRTMFIDMQRQFAGAMGIQLIYTTAVNDLEALSILPNIIRLRNERVDRNRGHRLLEIDEEITGLLDSAHIGKVEENVNTAPVIGESMHSAKDSLPMFEED
ncbi:MAG: hypothetical protein WC966_11930 [Bradymonadales bacterium]|jgi:hypothetical protein